MYRILAILCARSSGLLLGVLLIGCSSGIVVRKWYEPARKATNRSTVSIMLRQDYPARRIARIIDDEDFCIDYYRPGQGDTVTLYLPKSDWEPLQTGQPVRFRASYCTDWHIGGQP